MRIEAVVALMGAAVTSVFVPPEFRPFTASVLGTMVGAFGASVLNPRESTAGRIRQFSSAMAVGLLVAPWVMSSLPVVVKDELWHNFAASGLGAYFAAYIVEKIKEKLDKKLDFRPLGDD